MANNPSNIVGSYKVEFVKKSALCEETHVSVPEAFTVGTGDIKQKDSESLNVLLTDLRLEYGRHCRITLTLFEENWTA